MKDIFGKVLLFPGGHLRVQRVETHEGRFGPVDVKIEFVGQFTREGFEDFCRGMTAALPPSHQVADHRRPAAPPALRDIVT